MRYLFVMAHPDDEADVGGTIWKLSQQGNEVAVAITVGKAAARRNLSDTLSQEEADSMKTLGACKTFHADFPNIRMNTRPHIEVVDFIQNCIEAWEAEAIVTHHTADVNIDHAETARAVISACRSLKNNENVPRLRLFLMCETAGATEWALNSSMNCFVPNYYVEIDQGGLERKLRAHEAYKGVMRSYPHPQSREVYEGLAAYRGSQCGCNYAEAFQCVFQSE